MLESVLLENFKPFGTAQEAQLAPITLVYGPNSTGKSSLLQSLLLLKQSVHAPDGVASGLLPRGESVDLGSFTSMVHRHDTTRPLRLGVAFQTRPQRHSPGYEPIEAGRYAIEFAFRKDDSALARALDLPTLEEVRYRVLDAQPGLDCRLKRIQEAATGEYVPMGDFVYKVADLASRRSLAAYLHAQGLPEGGLPGKPKDLLAAVEASEIQEDRLFPRRMIAAAAYGAKPEEVLARIRRHEWSLGRVPRAFQAVLETVGYMGPLRSHPARYQVGVASTSASVGSRGEHTTALLLQRGVRATTEVNRWFKAFEIPYTLELRTIGDEVTGDIVVMTLVDQRTNVRVSPSDVGFGIGQLLPILVEGVLAEDRVLCVEQPEIHLHPRLQAHLADFFIETAGLRPLERRRGSRLKHQWIIETHSESLILRLQRRIREGRIAPEDVSVLYVAPAGDAGSRITRLRLDDEGEFLDEWPDGFFEESFDELFGVVGP